MVVLNSTDKNIIETFDNSFAHLKNEPIVIYGIGEKTKLIIEHLPEYNIVGILDKNSAGYSLYGTKVITEHEAVTLTKNIIIVANYSSAEIIYKRIYALEKEFGINIFHMNGTQMFPRETFDNKIKMQRKISLEELKNKILLNDVISFDIFDTLLVRSCLFPSDVFGIVERTLNEKINLKLNFTEIRISAEKKGLIKFGDKMTIHNVYEIIQSHVKFNPKIINQIKELELETEIKLAQERTEVLEAFKYAKKQKKQIVLTSDMYYPKEYMQKILNKIGIKDGFEIVVSCDIAKSKYRGNLWDYYIQKYSGLSILHIGDDCFSDIEQAQKRNINTFQIPSSSELFNTSSLCKLSKYKMNLQDRILMGHLIAKCFNNPFKDYNEHIIDNLFNVGYLFYGPLILNYVVWLVRNCLEQNITKILFIARDGYILQKLFNHLKCKTIEGIYFYTSRRALSVSTIKNEADIINVFNTFFVSRKIMLKQFLNTAFGIAAKKDDELKDKFLFDLQKEEVLNHIINTYKETILKNSKQEYNDYQKYISELNIEKGTRIGVINFVGAGVTQHFLEKLFSENILTVFYFLTKIEMKDINIKPDSIHSLYGDYLSSYTDNSNYLIRHFLTAEAVFSSPDEQFIKFKDGKLIFNQFDTKKDFSKMAQCHTGIEQLFIDMINLDDNIISRNFNNELIDNIFGFMFQTQNIDFSHNVKSAFSITDDYVPTRVMADLW